VALQDGSWNGVLRLLDTICAAIPNGRLRGTRDQAIVLAHLYSTGAGSGATDLTEFQAAVSSGNSAMARASLEGLFATGPKKAYPCNAGCCSGSNIGHDGGMTGVPLRPDGESVTQMETPEQEAEALALLDGLLARISDFEERDRTGYFNVEARSALAIDDLWAYPLRMSGSASLAINAAIDHLRTIRLLIEAQSLPWIAIFTLMRSAIETAAIAIWLLQEDDRDARLWRLLQLEWGEIADVQKLMANLGRELSPSRERREELVLRPLARRPSIGSEADLRRRGPSITEKIGLAQVTVNSCIPREGRPDRMVLALWQGMSGLTHGRSYAAQLLLDREELGYEPDTGAVDVRFTTGVRSLVGALRVAIDVVDVALRLFGARKVAWTSTAADLEDLGRFGAENDATGVQPAVPPPHAVDG